jgi:ABC-type transport system involved in multi-copper enzyme maturation permease subunit
MTWLVWRQHRGEALIASIGLGVLAAVLIITGIQIASSFQSLGVASCVAQPDLANCDQIERAFAEPYGFLTSALPWLKLLPAFVAILVGAPLIAREFEHGTQRLAWTQSVTRWRWLAVKLCLVLLGCLFLSAILTALLTWWLGPFNQIYGRFDPQSFDFEGVAPLGYMIFAVALAILAGTLLGRSIPAMVVTLVGFTIARLGIVLYARPNYQAPITQTWDALAQAPHIDPQAWQVDGGWITVSGNKVTADRVLSICNPNGGSLTTVGTSAIHSPFLQCAHDHGWRNFVTYQPADRFWLFQGIEMAIFLALAGACVALTFWLIRRRAA